MIKKIEFVGPERQSSDLVQAVEFLGQFQSALRGGATEVVLEYEKTDEGSVLTVKTSKPKVVEPVAKEVIASADSEVGVETTTTDAVTVEPVLDVITSVPVEKKRRKSTES
jgi:hypothetical protein